MYNNQNPNYPYGNSSNNGQMQPQYNQGYQQVNYPQYGQNQNNPQYVGNNNFSGYQVPSPAPKKSKKKIILISIVVVLLVVVAVVVFVVLGKKEDKKNPENSSSNGTVDVTLEEIMNQYGNKVEENLSLYLKENNKVPEKEEILELSKIDGYEIVCEIVQLSSTGKAYLGKCIINNSTDTYDYGTYSDERALLKEYGTRALAYVNDYEKANNKLPNTIDINFESKVECEAVKIYDSSNLYLKDCSVNGSKEKYSFGYEIEPGSVYITYAGHNYEVIGEMTTSDFESSQVSKKIIKCTTNDCSLDKYLGSYIAVKEKDGNIIIYDIKSSTSVFAVTSNLKYTFIERNGTEVYGVLLKNAKGQEALYSFADRRLMQEYGKYYYDWTPYISGDGVWGEYPSIETKKNLLPVRKTLKGKYGLINTYNGEVVLPFEYDTIFMDNQYINVTKNSKRGLIDLDGKKILLGGNFYDEFVIADHQELYVMTYGDNILQIVNIEGKLIKKIADIPVGYVLMKEDGYSSFYYKEEDGKIIFTVLFKTNKQGNPCAIYTYNLTNSTLNIDEDRCEAYKDK